MRCFSIVLSLVFISILLAAGEKHPAFAAKLQFAALQSQDNTTNSYKLSVGEELKINLRSNPTTGYRWQLADELDENVVKLVGSEFKAPDTRVLGAPGEEVWIFKAVGPGRTTIQMKYVRPWEKDVPPAKSAQFNIEVR